MINFIKNYKTIRPIWYISFALAILLTIMGYINLFFEITSLLLLIGIVRRCFKFENMSLLMQTILSAVLLAALHQIFSVLIWLIHHETPLALIPLLNVTSLLFCYIFIAKKTRPPKEPIKFKLTTIDLLAIVITIFSIGLISFSVFTNANSQRTLQYINGNVDDAAHLAMLNDKIHFDRGMTNQTKSADNIRGFTMYPTSWHSFNAVLIKAFYPNIKPGIHTLKAYAITKLLWFSILAFLLIHTSLSLYIKLRKSTNRNNLIGSSVILLLPVIILGIPLFKSGFYNFTPQLLTLLLVLWCIINHTSSSPLSKISLLLLLLCSSMLSWTLVTPSLLLFIIYYAYQEFKLVKPPLLILARNNIPYFFFWALCIFSVLVQTFAMSTDTGGGSVGLIEGLKLEGGIFRFNAIFLTLLFTCYCTGLFIFARKHQLAAKQYLYFTLFILLGVTIVYVIQQLAINTNAYYYYKMLLICIVLIIPLVFACIMLGINHMKQVLRAPVFVTGIAFIMIFFNTIGIEPLLWREEVSLPMYIKGMRTSTPSESNALYKTINTNLTVDKYNNRHVFFMYEPKRSDFSQITTNLLKAHFPSSPCYHNTLPKLLSDATVESQLSIIASACANHNVTIITSNEYKNILNNQGSKPSNLTVKSYEDVIKET